MPTGLGTVNSVQAKGSTYMKHKNPLHAVLGWERRGLNAVQMAFTSDRMELKRKGVVIFSGPPWWWLTFKKRLTAIRKRGSNKI